MENIKEIIIDKIQDAELVLVGIGEEFDDFAEKLKMVPKFADYLNRVLEKEDLQWQIPYIEAVYLKKYQDDKKKAAYEVLERLLEDKNYFILSTVMDDYIYHTSLKIEKIVTPCGGYRLLQCMEGCDNVLHESEGEVLEIIYENIQAGTDPALVKARYVLSAQAYGV